MESLYRESEMIRCPMRRDAYIHFSRVVEKKLSVLPMAIWARIFFQIRSTQRVDLMWSIATRFPAFAHIFIQEPRLWMIWSLTTGGVRLNSPQVRFAITLWKDLHEEGRQLPVDVKADSSTFHLRDVVMQLPLDSRPFIRSLRLRISSASYFNYGFANLMSCVPGLKHLSLGVPYSLVSPHHHSTAPSVFRCDQTTVPHVVSLTSLSLRNLIIEPESLSYDRWQNITRIRATYYRSIPSKCTPLRDILISATNLTDLFVHVGYSVGKTGRILFSVSSDHPYPSWEPRLSSVDVRGPRKHLPAFITFLLSHPRNNIQTIRVVYNCYPKAVDNLFREVPAFVAATASAWDKVLVDFDDLSVELVSGRHGPGVRRWFVRWRLYSYWRHLWPGDKFQHLENKFRLFVSRFVSHSPPRCLAITSHHPVASVFAAMAEPCRIRVLHLSGGFSMLECILLYILQYHTLFPVLDSIEYRSHFEDEGLDFRSVFTMASTFVPPLAPVALSRRILLTLCSDPDDDHIFELYGVLSWNLSSPKDSTIL